jgi:hypothetical protein
VANDRPRDMGTAHGPAGRFLQHGLERHLHAQFLKPLNHLPRPAHAVRAAALQKAVQLGRVGREEVAQHVHFAPRGGYRELTSGNDPHLIALTGSERFRNTRQGVVISQRDAVQASGPGAPDHTFWRETPIRGRGMHVEVNRLPGLCF